MASTLLLEEDGDFGTLRLTAAIGPHNAPQNWNELFRACQIVRGYKRNYLKHDLSEHSTPRASWIRIAQRATVSQHESEITITVRAR